MNTKLLLPNRFKRIGWLVFIPCFILTIIGLTVSETETLSSINFFGEQHFLSNWTSLKISPKGGLKEMLDSQDFAGEILMTLTAISFFFVAFSRERTDDEWIIKIRLESLLWAFYVHLIGFIVSVWVSYSLTFYVLLSWNLLTAPLVFLLRFHWLVYLKPYFEERKAAI
jgi:hypothetical protein